MEVQLIDKEQELEQVLIEALKDTPVELSEENITLIAKNISENLFGDFFKLL